MKFYKTRAEKLTGSGLEEIYKKAFRIYRLIRARSKRRPYIRSNYFQKQKIFLPIFWSHIHQKHASERLRRLPFFSCAIDLLIHSRVEPQTKVNAEKTSELLHRFGGTTKHGEIFYVQVKEDRATGEKWLLSVFPEK